MKTVNQEQIKIITAFIEKKDIVYADLQAELIDHFCCSIESQWEENPELSFNKAFHNEYKNFGVLGLGNVLDKRISELEKYYRKSIGKHMLHWLKIPQIFATLLLSYVLYLCYSSEYNIYIRNIFFIGLFTYSISHFIFSNYKVYKMKKQGEPILLMDKIIAEAGGISFLFFIPLQSKIIEFSPDVFSTTKLSFWISYSIITFLYVFLTAYDFPKNKNVYFRSQFPIISQ